MEYRGTLKIRFCGMTSRTMPVAGVAAHNSERQRRGCV